MAGYAAPVQTLIDELSRLPGIGPKSAQRIAFHLLKKGREESLRLSRAIVEMVERVGFCQRCFNISDQDLCGICRDSGRDLSVVCVVEEPRDVMAIERTGDFRGTYHVLQGVISPMDGVGPDRVRIKELLTRIEREGIHEVIIATNPTLEGEATAMYLAKVVKPLGATASRIASGLPVGGDLEYADELTLGKALAGRRELPG
jgi:recombination protein RecR